MGGQQQNINQITQKFCLQHISGLQIFFVSYIVFLLSHFICQKAIYSSLLFYLTLIPSFIYCVYKSIDDIKEIYSDNKILVLLFLYLTAHSFVMIGNMEPNLALKGLRNILATALFVATSLFFFKSASDKVKHYLFLIFTITCGTLALFSIILHLYNGLYIADIRIVPLGFARHEILGASLYGVAGIIAIYLLFNACKIHKKILFASIFFTILIMILLTVSRGPILSYISCSGLAILIFSRNIRATIILSALVIILVIGVIFLIPEYREMFFAYGQKILERGTSYRFTLWILTIDSIIERPILGYGVRNVFESDVPGGHSPHNLYLSTAYYFGIPALLILLGVLTQAIKRSLKGFAENHYSKLLFILLLHSLFSVMTDHGQLVRGNTAIWIIFWLPICMCLAYKSVSKHQITAGS